MERENVSEVMHITKKEHRPSRKWNGDISEPVSFADRIQFLQRTVGNQAVERIIRSRKLQAALRIGQPDDAYEQEADRVADQVMRMPEPMKMPDNNHNIQRVCPLVEEEGLNRQPVKEEEEEEKKLRMQPLKEDEEEKLQAKKNSDHVPEVHYDIENQIQSMKGGGRALSEGERAFFEPRFGYDFSEVRLHTDAKAADSARAVNAQAYTIGKDVVFGSDKYSTDSDDGKKLLAHELTHVIQQNG